MIVFMSSGGEVTDCLALNYHQVVLLGRQAGVVGLAGLPLHLGQLANHPSVRQGSVQERGGAVAPPAPGSPQHRHLGRLQRGLGAARHRGDDGVRHGG